MRENSGNKCKLDEKHLMPHYKDMFKKKPKTQSVLRKIRHLLPECALNKTSVCKHDHGCLENIYRMAFWYFMVGFFVSILIKNANLILVSPIAFLHAL